MTKPPHGRIHLSSEITGYYRAVIDNPPINLADPEFFYDLRWIIDKLDADDEARVLVFESSTPDFFLAHFDVVKGQAAKRHSPGPTGLPLWPDLTTRLAQAPYVSIASIRGRARGVGSEFVLACDLRFASRELAVLGQPEVGLGLFPGGGGTERLPRLVGRARALEVILGCEDFDADTAERYGYVNRAIPDDELDAFVDRLAGRIASFDRPALAKGKALVNHSSPLPAGADLVASEEAFFAAFAWPGTQQRIARLFELGFQQPGDVEQRLGDVVGELAFGSAAAS
jgi:enoyl-CoA hydratase/carnithine racemase